MTKDGKIFSTIPNGASGVWYKRYKDDTLRKILFSSRYLEDASITSDKHIQSLHAELGDGVLEKLYNTPVHTEKGILFNNGETLTQNNSADYNYGTEDFTVGLWVDFKNTSKVLSIGAAISFGIDDTNIYVKTEGGKLYATNSNSINEGFKYICLHRVSGVIYLTVDLILENRRAELIDYDGNYSATLGGLFVGYADDFLNTHSKIWDFNGAHIGTKIGEAPRKQGLDSTFKQYEFIDQWYQEVFGINRFEQNGNTITNYGEAESAADVAIGGVQVLRTTNVSYLEFTDLTAITITESAGTATPSIATNRINFTEGYINYLKLSNGSYFLFQEGAGNIISDYSGNAMHALFEDMAPAERWTLKIDSLEPLKYINGYNISHIGSSSYKMCADPFNDNLGANLVTSGGWTAGDGWREFEGTFYCDGTQTASSEMLKEIWPESMHVMIEVDMLTYSAGQLSCHYKSIPQEIKKTIFCKTVEVGTNLNLVADADFIGSFNVKLRRLMPVTAYAEYIVGFNRLDYDLDIYFTSTEEDVLAGGNYYIIDIAQNGTLTVDYAYGTNWGTKLVTAAGYIDANTDYNVKLIKSVENKIYIYIKGGTFSDWTLVVPATGDNPFTEVELNEFNYIEVHAHLAKFNSLSRNGVYYDLLNDRSDYNTNVTARYELGVDGNVDLSGRPLQFLPRHITYSGESFQNKGDTALDATYSNISALEFLKSSNGAFNYKQLEALSEIVYPQAEIISDYNAVHKLKLPKQEVFNSNPTEEGGKWIYEDNSGNGKPVQICDTAVITTTPTSYLKLYDLEGTTIVKSSGTAVPTKVTDTRVNLTAGYLSYIEFSDGSYFRFQEGTGTQTANLAGLEGRVALKYCSWGTNNAAEPVRITKGFNQEYLLNSMYTFQPVEPRLQNLGPNIMTENGWIAEDGWTVNGLIFTCDGTQTTTSNVAKDLGLVLTQGYMVLIEVLDYTSGVVSILGGDADDPWSEQEVNNSIGKTSSVLYAKSAPKLTISADSTYVGSIKITAVKSITKIPFIGTWEFAFRTSSAYDATACGGTIALSRGGNDIYPGPFPTVGVQISNIDNQFVLYQAHENYATDILMMATTDFFTYPESYEIKIVARRTKEVFLYARGHEYVDWTLIEADTGSNPAILSYIPMIDFAYPSSSGASLFKFSKDGISYDIEDQFDMLSADTNIDIKYNVGSDEGIDRDGLPVQFSGLTAQSGNTLLGIDYKCWESDYKTAADVKTLENVIIPKEKFQLIKERGHISKITTQASTTVTHNGETVTHDGENVTI